MKGPEAISKRAKEKRLIWLRQGIEDAKNTKDPEHAMGCMLFWAEGGKRRNSVQFTNCDSRMMKFFIDFIRKFYQVDKSSIRIEIRSYVSNKKEEKRINDFWINTLGLCNENIYRHFIGIDKRGGKCLKYEYGTCQIRICNTELAQRLYGAIQYYAKFHDESWVNFTNS